MSASPPSQRRIARPHRPRSSGSRSNIREELPNPWASLSDDSLPPRGESPGTSLPSKTSDFKFSTSPSAVPATARHLSRPYTDSIPSSFDFNQSGRLATDNQQNPFAHLTLPNDTAQADGSSSRSPFQQSGTTPASSKATSVTPSSTLSSIRFTPESEFAQPLSTLYSDEKIPVDGSDLPELVSSLRITLSEETIANSTPPQSAPSFSFSPSPSPFSSPSPHSRNHSAATLSSGKTPPIPYDVKSETAPPELFFSETFQNILRDGLRISKNVVDALGKMERNRELEGDIKRLMEDARKLVTFVPSTSRVIAVLGDSGEGKSSLINSLLHFPEIAKTGDIGSACTSVVTEYRQRTEDQSAPITIEVEYLSRSEIEELIKELVWNYRQLFLPEIESEGVNAKDYERYERESELAWSALQAAFKHQTLFNKEFLSDESEGALERITNQLTQWTTDLDWPESGQDAGFWRSSATDADECCQKTSAFMQDRLWPFTKIIRVYLDSQVLKTGIVLADLPGLQDTNLARVRSTQDYLVNCDHIFIVAKISRVVTDQSLKSSIYSVLSRHIPLEWEESAGQNLKLAIVCTKSEDIKMETARREFCGPGKRIEQSVMDQLDMDIRNARDSDNKVLKKELKRKQKLLLIKARSDHVKEGLRDAYVEKVSGGGLEVFCVSNMLYEKYTKKGNTDMVHASGIPNLRRFCHTITADAQYLEAKHFLKSKLASLLNSVELWACQKPADTESEGTTLNASFEELFGDVKTELQEILKESKSNFQDNFQELLLECLERRHEHWEGAAAAKATRWRSYHWTQYNAWCHHNGDHSTARRDRVNWNAEIIWKMRMELEYQWDMFEEDIPTTFQELSDSITNKLRTVQSQIQEYGLTSTLAKSIDVRILDVEYQLRQVNREFEREVNLIRRHTSEPNAISYVVKEMVPAYRLASQTYGTGMGARQHIIVEERITNGTLFPNVATRIASNMGAQINHTFSELQDSIDLIYGLIETDVTMALSTATQNTGEDDAWSEEDASARQELADEIERLVKEHEKLVDAINSSEAMS